ncbi:glycosyltransferase [Venenivibrio stagnispumantis]|uniref:UDP-N-acetylmuramyl pentapeptide phosphotransferase/UDP-N-acetylglucosamine-1-phosphate transferase n=1 Tax=Venenivibrio stagnispumantis TaxID=407998 RepID=A0AA46AF00_9AQUI|nr:glycosyltransferase [Venenivibrio stagnispumantis]MCW4573217.1 glycosyltransferase [Venenivibrio stagnispumantis]SMP17169.1 UDP-N-acetylmuramyl pentapeptide phosphotransferase/UDP-N-acetylglucosamine-1-phosphate transferase [Venenivibrio stagnispumantis]
MKHFLISFIISFIINFLIIKLAKRINKLITDHLHHGPQKFHVRPTPRLGGVGIYLAFLFMSLYGFAFNLETKYSFIMLIVSSFLVFLSGILEDITKSLQPKIRLIFMAIGAGLAYFLLDTKIIRLDIPYIDIIIAIPIISFIFTIFAIVGLTNAINIIDGFNGLAGGVSIMIFLAIAYIAYQTNDQFVLLASFVMIGAILGFFVFNYPYGLIFLGDGGAYFIGFVMAVLSILLVKNHNQVSAWFPVMVAIYPIYETLFSIYRRKFLKKTYSMAPDSMHLHSIFYKTIVKKLLGTHNPIYRNPATSPLVWGLNSLGIIPAVFFYNNTPILIISVLIFIFIYTKIYFSIIKSKLPKNI